MKPKINILIADDHSIVASGIQAILNKDDFHVLAVVSNGQEVLEFLEQQTADIVLMDINMPIMNGIDCTRKLKKKFPDVKVLVLTMYNQKHFIKGVLDVGADGCVLKSNTGKELLTAIERVQSGKTYFDHLHEFKDANQDLKEIKLSERELEVILQISEGMTSKEIASSLHISEHTVKTHRKNIFRKLKVKDVTELLQFAMNNGIL